MISTRTSKPALPTRIRPGTVYCGLWRSNCTSISEASNRYIAGRTGGTPALRRSESGTGRLLPEKKMVGADLGFNSADSNRNQGDHA